MLASWEIEKELLRKWKKEWFFPLLENFTAKGKAHLYLMSFCVRIDTKGFRFLLALWRVTGPRRSGWGDSGIAPGAWSETVS